MEGENRQERFVDADSIARALRETRRYVLYLARTGAIRSYPMGGRQRIKRKFLLSEVRSDLVGRKRKIRRKRNEAIITAAIKAERKPKSESGTPAEGSFQPGPSHSWTNQGLGGQGTTQ